MSKLEIRKMIFEARVENFLYIDRTGLFFKKLQELVGIDNFTPNITDSSFVLSNKTFQGSLSPQNVGFVNIQPSSPEEFEPIVKKVLMQFAEVYEAPRLKRIGYRLLYFQEKDKRSVLGLLKKLYIPSLKERLLENIEKPKLVDDENIEVKYTFNVHNDIYITFRAYTGEKTTQDEKNPKRNITQKGLVVDIDCYNTYSSKDSLLTSNFAEKELPSFLRKSSSASKSLIQNFQNFRG